MRTTHPQPALSIRQRRLYKDRITIWRHVTENAPDGEYLGESWQRVHEGIPCLFRTGVSMFGPHGEVLGEGDNLLSADTIHFSSQTDLQPADVMEVTRGDELGKFFECRGEPRYRTWRAGKFTVEASRLEAPPWGIDE